MQRESSWSGTRSETLAAVAAVVSMLAAFAAVAAYMVWGAMAASESAGVVVFLAALVLGPIYAQTLRRNSGRPDDAAWRRSP